MAHATTVLRVFVSSPGDLADERALVPEVCEELNRILERSGIRLEPVMWETHGRPGVGADPQDVLNQQHLDDCDIFLGLLGARFGSPTHRAESGTAEEFDRALRRFDENPKRVRVLTYFKDSPVPLSQVDPEQLLAVRRFRERIRPRVLHYTFTTREEFGKMLRVHLAAEAAEWGKTWGGTASAAETDTAAAPTPPASGEAAQEDELGLLDLVDIGVQHMNNVTDSTVRMTEVTEALGRKLSERAEEIKSATSDDQKKRVVNRSAADLGDFVSRMEAEVDLMARSAEKGLDAMARGVELLTDFGEPGRGQARELLNTIRSLGEAIGGARPNLAGMRSTVGSFPRLTAVLATNAIRTLTAVQRAA